MISDNVAATQRPDDGPTDPPFRFLNYIWIAIYWFSLSFLWGGFLSVVLPALNEPLAVSIFGEGSTETARGLLTAIGLIIAMIAQPLAGAISDQSTSRFGRRRPFMIAGTAIGFVALALCGLAGSWWILLLGYLLLQFGDNISQGAYQGLMPDVVPEAKRGKASAALAVSQLSGTLVGAVVPAVMQASFGKIPGSQITLLLVGIVFTIALTLTVLFVKERPFVPTRKVSAVEASLSMFKGVSKYPDFILLMVSRLLFLTAPATLSLFAVSFLEKQGFVKPKVDAANQPILQNGRYVVEAGNTLSILLGITIIGAVLASFPASLLSERIGRKRVIYLAGFIGMTGGLLMLIPNAIMQSALDTANRNYSGFAAQQAYLDTVRPGLVTLIIVFGLLVGTSWGAFMAVDWAFATELIPIKEAGRYMGLSNLASAGCQAVAAAIGGVVVASALGFVGLFVTLALYYVTSLLVLTRVRETKGRAATYVPPLAEVI